MLAPPVTTGRVVRADRDPAATFHLLKRSLAERPVTIDQERLEDDEEFDRIRCPLCDWRPAVSSRWSCSWTGAPEPRFESCSTTWNTFDTHGRCPGCHHQWQWTSCHRCGQWSLHEEWYDTGEARH